MKFKHLLYAGAALLAFSACSKEDADTGNGGNESGEGAYLSLSISTGTRSVNTSGTTTDPGTDAEREVKSLMIFLYDLEGNPIQDYQKTYEAKDLVPQNPKPSTNNTVTYSVPKFRVPSGPKKVVVIVNPATRIFTDNMTLAEMHNSVKIQPADFGGNGTTVTDFVMTNANTALTQDINGDDVTTTDPNDDGFYPDGSFAVNVTGSKEYPTVVTIPVERVLAKIEDKTENYTKIVTGTNGDEVTFTKVALINGNSKFFPIKKLRKSNDDANDYVVDPNFVNNSSNTLSEEFINRSSTAFFDDSFSIKAKELSTANPAHFYTLENTMIAGEQYNAYTTGLYYQAVYKVSGGTDNQNVYKYLGKVYNFDGLSNAAAGLGLSLTGLTDASEATAFAAIGVTKYMGGVCYYPYWIRHVSDGDNTKLGVMEFAVVRNNLYEMTIKSVKGIGTPDPVDPDPETPDESADVYLQVAVKVMPWTVRSNEIEF